MRLTPAQDAASAKPSAARKRFDQLLAQIAKQREQLATFQRDSDAIVARWGKRVQAEKLAVQHGLWEFVLALDVLVQKPNRAVSTAQRKILSELLQELMGALEHCPDPALLDALHQRYHGQTVAEQQQDELSALKDSFTEQFGPESLEEFQGKSIDEFFAFTRAKLKTLSEENAYQASGASDFDNDLFGPSGFVPPKQKKTKRQQQQEAIQVDLEQSVRELFRKLISELHPDRESDPELRERKSEWMKRANLAYKENDILGLWLVRAEFANQTSLSLNELSESRLKGFCSSLSQQLERLKSDQHKAATELSQRLELMPQAIPNNLLQLERLLQQRSSECVRQAKELRHDLELLKDPKISPQFVKQLCAEHRKHKRESAMAEDFGEFDDFLADLVQSFETDQKRAKRRR